MPHPGRGSLSRPHAGLLIWRAGRRGAAHQGVSVGLGVRGGKEVLEGDERSNSRASPPARACHLHPQAAAIYFRADLQIAWFMYTIMSVTLIYHQFRSSVATPPPPETRGVPQTGGECQSPNQFVLHVSAERVTQAAPDQGRRGGPKTRATVPIAILTSQDLSDGNTSASVSS
jgi:hypothetical protein